MTSISDKILAIEKQIDLESYRFKGENVWPIIRISIYLSSTKSSSAGISVLKSFRFLLGGVWQFLSRGIINAVTRSKYDAVLVTTSHYKVQENGKTFDKIIDPVIQYLKKIDMKFSVWEFTGKFKYDKHISYNSFLRPIQQEIYFLSFLRKLGRPFIKRDILMGNVSHLNNLLKENDIKFSVNKSFMGKLETIFFQAEFFQSAIKTHDVKHVFMVCYYDVKCFSVLLATNRLGISSIDLQHGVQGKKHLAYALWPQEIIKSTKLLPTHFYVWDDNSYKTIQYWKNEGSKILLGSNNWILDRVNKVGNNIILVTLQPIDNFLPDYLIEMIRVYSGDRKWYIRLHPRQMPEMNRIEKIFFDAGLMGKVNIKEASVTSLTTLLESTVLHITYFSSVVIEASYYNIPTYFLNEVGLSHYSDYLQDDLIYCYPNDNVMDVIQSITSGKTHVLNRNENRINVLENFINDK